MSIKDEIELKDFDTGLFVDSKLSVYGVTATLEIELLHLENETLYFENVRFFRFTTLHACDLDMINAYFKVVSLPESKELSELLSKLRNSGYPNDSLKHFRIFIDDKGCYDLFAESVSSSE